MSKEDASSANVNDKTNINESHKTSQSKLREIQLKRDNYNTYGYDYKDPCKKERKMSFDCIETSGYNNQVDCKDYFENFKVCKQFWGAVVEYRARYMKKSRYDLPKDEEFLKWKAKLPEWLETKKITPPDDI